MTFWLDNLKDVLRAWENVFVQTLKPSKWTSVYFLPPFLYLCLFLSHLFSFCLQQSPKAFYMSVCARVWVHVCVCRQYRRTSTASRLLLKWTHCPAPTFIQHTVRWKSYRLWLIPQLLFCPVAMDTALQLWGPVLRTAQQEFLALSPLLSCLWFSFNGGGQLLLHKLLAGNWNKLLTAVLKPDVLFLLVDHHLNAVTKGVLMSPSDGH